MQIQIFNHHPKFRISRLYLEAKILKLRSFLLKKGKLSLHFIDRKSMKKINSDYRGKNKITDVLSFCYGEKNLWGEIYLCSDVVDFQAKELKRSFRDQALILVIHGLAHLLGYDHMNKKDLIEMKKIEEGFLKKINLPYEPLTQIHD